MYERTGEERTILVVSFNQHCLFLCPLKSENFNTEGQFSLKFHLAFEECMEDAFLFIKLHLKIKIKNKIVPTIKAPGMIFRGAPTSSNTNVNAIAKIR